MLLHLLHFLNCLDHDLVLDVLDPVLVALVEPDHLVDRPALSLYLPLVQLGQDILLFIVYLPQQLLVPNVGALALPFEV